MGGTYGGGPGGSSAGGEPGGAATAPRLAEMVLASRQPAECDPRAFRR